MLLLALALFLTPNAGAFRCRPRRGRRTQVSVSTNTNVNGNDYNTTTTAGEEGPTSNTTLPKECDAVADECLDKLGSLADTNHNETTADTDKDTALQDFCATDCGKKYVEGDECGGVLFVCSGRNVMRYTHACSPLLLLPTQLHGPRDGCSAGQVRGVLPFPRERF